MSEGLGPKTNDGPAEFLRRWQEASFGAWSDALAGGEAYADPLGLYRQWLGAVGNAGKTAGEALPAGSQEVWQAWTEATAEVWRRFVGLSELFMEISPYLLEMADGVRDGMLENGLTLDPLEFYKRWYEATNAPLTKAITAVVENEQFLQDSRRFMENYATLEGVFQRTSGQFFDYLQLATHDDTTRIADLIVGLDGKVDRLEEAFEEFEYGHEKPASAESVESVEDRVKNLESRLEDHRSGLERVEGKLDRLLSVLEASAGVQEATASRSKPDATDAARRKARDLGVDLRGVRGSGDGGRITIDDVRKAGGTG